MVVTAVFFLRLGHRKEGDMEELAFEMTDLFSSLGEEEPVFDEGFVLQTEILTVYDATGRAVGVIDLS